MTTMWVVQTCWDGIPEEPVVFDERDAAIREYVGAGVTGDLPFDDERQEFNNSEARHREVRMWEIDVPTSPAQVCWSELEPAEVAEFDRIRALLATPDPERSDTRA